MSQSSRISAAIVFLLAMSFSWSATPSGYDMLQQTLTQSVHAAMQSAGSDINVPVIEEAAIRANALSSLQIDSAASQPTLTFGFSSVPLYTARMEQTPPRLVLEFLDTVLLSDLQKIVIDGGNMIDNVDTTIAVFHPQFITRATVALPKACAFDVHQKGTALTVTLHPAKRIDAASALQGTDAATLGLAAIAEEARRTDAAYRDRLSELDQKIHTAAQFIERARVALIRADLTELLPVADTAAHAAAARDMRQETASQGNRTHQLERGHQQLLSHRDMNRAQAQMDIAAQHADQNSAGAILKRFSNNERTFGEDLANLLAQTDQQTRANERLAMRIEQLGAGTTALAGGHHTEGRLNQLDRAFLALRETARPAETIDNSLSALDSTMQSVATAPVDLAVQNETQMAVLANTTGRQNSLTPPAPRTRPTSREFNTNLIENPIRMAVLRASSSELEAAADNGILVMAQQQTTGITEAEGRPSTPVQGRTDTSGPRRYRVPKTSGARPQFSLYNEGMPADQDPLRQLVNIDFREMDLSNVVSLLAQKGEINVIAGTEVSGTVTANLKNIPLGRAIEIVLRMNGLGIVEEAGVYRITTYDEAISSQRETKMVFLKNAQADDVKATLDDVLVNATNGDLISVSANPATNVVILSGPREAVEQLEGVVAELDVAEPVVPTITVPIKLNYSEPLELLPVILELVSDDVGSVTADTRGRHIVVTDIPVKVQEIQALIASIDLPVKQVAIDAMIVDAQLDDDAQTGLDWILQSTQRKLTTNSFTFEDDTGTVETLQTGDLVSEVGAATSFLPVTAGSQIFFKILGGDLDLSALIAAEVTSKNAELLANPTITTVENQPAIIRIVQEFPYQELTQTSEGGSIGSTKFKEIGTILEVTPRVTHDNNIIAKIDAKESSILGFTSAEVPIEAKRQAQTTLRLADGQTIFIGGMRSFEDRLSVRKTPILGDIPILNFLFSHKRSEQTNTELLIFLTCNVLPEDMPELTPYEKERFDKLGGTPQQVDGTRAVVKSYIHPEEQRDPFYKWKRTK